jgi:hypothetical protein
MRQSVSVARLGALILTASAWCVAHADDYHFEVVVDNGPHAGKYNLTASQPCNRVIDGMGLYFDRNVEAAIPENAAAAKRALGDAKALNTVILQLDDWDGKSAPKWGKAMLIFGPMKEGELAAGSKVYEVVVREKVRDGSGTFQAVDKPKDVGITFQGQTADGIKFRATGSCKNPFM